MSNTKRVTERDMYEVIKAMAENENREDIIKFADKKIAQIDNKAQKAKERADAKRKEGDALQNAVLAALTKEPMSIDEIVDNVNFDEEVTRGKIVPRLNQLVAQGAATKGTIKIEGSKRKVVSYRLSTELAMMVEDE